jgi:hypothetical protein
VPIAGEDEHGGCDTAGLGGGGEPSDAALDLTQGCAELADEPEEEGQGDEDEDAGEPDRAVLLLVVAGELGGRVVAIRSVTDDVVDEDAGEKEDHRGRAREGRNALRLGSCAGRGSRGGCWGGVHRLPPFVAADGNRPNVLLGAPQCK